MRMLFARGDRVVIALSASATLLLVSRASRATDFEVDAQTAAQSYDVASPWGDTILGRRRLMQTLGLAAYSLQGQYKPGEADYSVAVRMRLDADFGINGQLPPEQAGAETNYGVGNGVRYVPGLQEAPLDLMYAYVEGRNLAHGWFGFRLGRQYMTDMLGWWSFDGALARVTTPFYVQAEVYGGLEQRGGLPFSTSRYEPQGIWRGSHSDFGGGSGSPSVVDYPSYQYAEPAPAFGFVLETSGVSFIHGRFDYRRVYNTGPVLTQQFPDPGGGYRQVDGSRLSQERFGYALDANKPDLGGVKAGFSYDLYSQIVSTFYGGLDVYVSRAITLGADIDYYVPVFDADSIFNWFTRSPVQTLLARASIRFTKRFDVTAEGGVRQFKADGDPDTFGQGQCKAVGQQANPNCPGGYVADPSADQALSDYSRNEDNRQLSTLNDGLAELMGRYRWPSGDVWARGMAESGGRGRLVGADLSGTKRFEGGRYMLGGLVSLYNWYDNIRVDTDGQLGRDATSFQYVISGGYRPADFADLRLEWEHDMNKLAGQRFRVLALLNLLVMR